LCVGFVFWLCNTLHTRRNELVLGDEFSQWLGRRRRRRRRRRSRRRRRRRRGRTRGRSKREAREVRQRCRASQLFNRQTNAPQHTPRCAYTYYCRSCASNGRETNRGVCYTDTRTHTLTHTFTHTLTQTCLSNCMRVAITEAINKC